MSFYSVIRVSEATIYAWKSKYGGISARSTLSSKPPRTAAGYRIFPSETARRRQFIKRAQELGKSGLLDHFVNPAIQVAAAADALPEWCESILPGYASVGRAAMLHKDELTASLQDALHLLERPLRVHKRTQSPRQDNPYGQNAGKL